MQTKYQPLLKEVNGLPVVYCPFTKRNFSLKELWSFKTKTIYKKDVYKEKRGTSLLLHRIGTRYIKQIVRGPFEGAYIVKNENSEFVYITLDYQTAARIAIGYKGCGVYSKGFYVEYSGYSGGKRPEHREWGMVFGHYSVQWLGGV